MIDFYCIYGNTGIIIFIIIGYRARPLKKMFNYSLGFYYNLGNLVPTFLHLKYINFEQ